MTESLERLRDTRGNKMSKNQAEEFVKGGKECGFLAKEDGSFNDPCENDDKKVCLEDIANFFKNNL